MSGVNYTDVPEFFGSLNNSLQNLGNSTTDVNYGSWGSDVSVAPLSGFKASVYEGGTRAPFIIREPVTTAESSTAANTTSASPAMSSSINNTSSASSSPSPITTSNPIKSSIFVTDITPTILDFAQVSPPGSTYNGTEVHPIMGKSIKPLLNSSAETIHGVNDPIGTELFNSTAVYKGPWKAIYDGAHPTGKWRLYDIVNDPGENNNLADQHPDLLQRMTGEYHDYYGRLIEEVIWSLRSSNSWQIIPVNFQKRHTQMLEWAYTLMSKRFIKIHPSLQQLIVSLRTAIVSDEWKLDKQQSSQHDTLDSFMLSLCNY